jgi:hypothetical protein
VRDKFSLGLYLRESDEWTNFDIKVHKDVDFDKIEWSTPLVPFFPWSIRPCLDFRILPKFHYTKRRFSITSKYRYIYEVLNVDEIKN